MATNRLTLLHPVERECLNVLRLLTARLGRAPTVQEVSVELGIGQTGRAGARRYVEALIERGIYRPLPAELTRQQRVCLRAVHILTERLGRSPSTREVSAEMGLSPGASRNHIDRLVQYGLLTPPEARLMMVVTDAGKRFL